MLLLIVKKITSAIYFFKFNYYLNDRISSITYNIFPKLLTIIHKAIVYGVMIASTSVIDEEVKVAVKMNGKKEIAKWIKEENVGVTEI